MSTKTPLWQITAQDVMKHHGATGEPVSHLVSTLSRARKLGSRDRKLVGEAVYALVRELPWPTWFLKKLDKEYGKNAPELIKALRERAKPVLAVDKRHCQLDQVQESLQQQGIETRKSALLEGALVVESTDFSWEKIPKELQKSLWLMDEASQIAARSVAAKPGELVLDMCAGGGGKTRYLLQTDAQIVAMDSSEKRIRASLEREGLESAWHVVADGMKPPFSDGTFAWIIIDAPCSGTGTLRRAPDLLSRIDERNIKSCVETQRGLLKNAAALLKPSGHLIYVTCSVLPEENRQMLAWIKDELKLLKPQPLAKIWGSDVKIELSPEANFIQLLPSAHGCDGFFIAAFTANK